MKYYNSEVHVGILRRHNNGYFQTHFMMHDTLKNALIRKSTIWLCGSNWEVSESWNRMFQVSSHSITLYNGSNKMVHGRVFYCVPVDDCNTSACIRLLHWDWWQSYVNISVTVWNVVIRWGYPWLMHLYLCCSRMKRANSMSALSGEVKKQQVSKYILAMCVYLGYSFLSSHNYFSFHT